MIKPLVLSLAAVLLTSAAPARQSPAGNAPPDAPPLADPCDGLSTLRDDPGCGDGPLCTARDRVALACQVRDAIEKRYVFLAVKGRLLTRRGGEPFDARRHLDACVAEE